MTSTAIRTPFGYYLQGAWMDEGGSISLSYQHLSTGTQHCRQVTPQEDMYQAAQALLRRMQHKQEERSKA